MNRQPFSRERPMLNHPAREIRACRLAEIVVVLQHFRFDLIAKVMVQRGFGHFASSQQCQGFRRAADVGPGVIWRFTNVVTPEFDRHIVLSLARDHFAHHTATSASGIVTASSFDWYAAIPSTGTSHHQPAKNATRVMA